MTTDNLILDIQQHITVDAPIAEVFDGFIYQLTDGMKGAEDAPLPLKLEQYPGGRWYRDLGEGSGHLWALVQSIKRPTLLELYGQLFMSSPVTNHLIVRLCESENGTSVELRHEALGLIDEQHRQGVNEGWKEILEATKNRCE